MKDDKPHGQWLVLQALIALPPFGQSANDLSKHLTQAKSGLRTRLKELEDMGLVSSEDRHPHRVYHLTIMGSKVGRAGENGQMALRIMRTSHAALEAQRADELAPIKEKWDHIIRNQMQMIALGTLSKL